MNAVFQLDKAKVRRSFGSACDTYDSVAELQRKVGLHLLETTESFAPTATVLDVGCGTGFISAELLKRSKFKQLVAMDIALPMLRKAREKLQTYESVSYLCADAECLGLQAESVDHIVSNVALQWCQDLPAVFAGFYKALKPGGSFQFTTFGEQTLGELKQAWVAVDHYRHVNDFYNELDLKRFLSEVGFKSIEINTIFYRSEYASVVDLMKELKGIGARNMSMDRKKQMTTRAQLIAMSQAYPKRDLSNSIVATFEVILVKAKV